MRDATTGAALWATSPTVKEKNAAHRNMTALLDALAPEQAVRRAERPRLRVERHRTPGGAVLQASNAALSLSWFPEAVKNSALGELRVLVWQGTVVRRGAPRAREGAVVIEELVLRPVESPTDDKVWVTLEGVKYDTASLAEHCLAILERQILKSSPPGALAEPAT